MFRRAAQFLSSWQSAPRRLPLVVRGARQTGKTWLVHDLAERTGLTLVECNFERDPDLARCFASNDPGRIVGELELAFDTRIEPGSSLLFLDEIQAEGTLLAKLRWFAEELPELAVVAAGSLLEFTLGDHELSLPVGRIAYLHVEPMTFSEFLLAHGQERLLEAVDAWTPIDGAAGTGSSESEMSAAAVDAGLRWFDRYAMVGGMPAVVQADTDGAEPVAIRRLQHDLVTTYRDDFGKYSGRMDHRVLDAVMTSVAAQLGRRFVYSHVEEGLGHRSVRRALELLAMARVCHVVRCSDARGMPLGAEVRSRSRKVVALDIGLVHALLGTPAASVFPAWESLAPGLRGALTEQLVGQQLRGGAALWAEPRLFFWQRGGGRPGEIDYVTQVDTDVVPVETKAGRTGSLKSLHQFMSERALDLAVRVDRNAPRLQDVDVKTTNGARARYRLLNISPFLVERLHELCRACRSS